MTRDNHKNSHQTQPSLTIPTEDSIVNLPDLSTFQDEEKQHILNVLQRDEDLRNRHLSRFMTLRKEVADLEEQSQPASPSICARCRTPFSFIFNTGDACPKCAAKVCKQCRLMYNGNDDSWLCQLCCKQMQLMSYSGEWIYSLHSNLRKNSRTTSEVLDEPLPSSISAQNVNVESSSDSELEHPVSVAHKTDRFQLKPVPVQPTKPVPKDKINTMIVQNSIDERKLNFVRTRIKDRPLHETYTQPLPRRTRQIALTSNTIHSSSDDANPLLNQTNNRQGRLKNKQNPPISKHVEVLKPDQNEIDFGSVTSSEWGGGEEENNKIEKEKLKAQQKKQQPQPSTHNSKLSLASTTTVKSNRRNLSGSMQSLRDAVHRIPHPHISSSRISLTSEKNRKAEITKSSTIDVQDTISLKVPDISNSRTKLTTPQSSIDESKQPSSKTNHLDSSTTAMSTNTTHAQPVQRNQSFTDSEYNRQDSAKSKPESLGNQESVADSEDDVDNRNKKRN